MPTSTYQVVTQTITTPQDPAGNATTYTLTAPAGKKPLAGAYNTHLIQGQGYPIVTSSYPNGQDWVFKLVGNTTWQYTVDLYLITAAV